MLPIAHIARPSRMILDYFQQRDRTRGYGEARRYLPVEETRNSLEETRPKRPYIESTVIDLVSDSDSSQEPQHSTHRNVDIIEILDYCVCCKNVFIL